MHQLWLSQRNAGVAQLVEQLIRNEKVEGSTPFSGTIDIKALLSGRAMLFVQPI